MELNNKENSNDKDFEFESDMTNKNLSEDKRIFESFKYLIKNFSFEEIFEALEFHINRLLELYDLWAILLEEDLLKKPEKNNLEREKSVLYKIKRSGKVKVNNERETRKEIIDLLEKTVQLKKSGELTKLIYYRFKKNLGEMEGIKTFSELAEVSNLSRFFKSSETIEFEFKSIITDTESKIKIKDEENREDDKNNLGNSYEDQPQKANVVVKIDYNKLANFFRDINYIVREIKRIYEMILEDGKVYLLDGMHGGILFKDFLGTENPNRYWDNFKGFPVGFEEFDWPNFAMKTIINNLELAKNTNIPITTQIGLSTYESLNDFYPNFIQSMKNYFDTDVAELVDGSYSQPYDISQGAETNVREFLIGLETAERLFNRRPRVYVRQEFGYHPQLPQILRNLGYYGVSTRVRCNGWIRGIPYSFIRWVGPDGSEIPCIPTHLGIHTGDMGGGSIFRKFHILLYQYLIRKNIYNSVIFSNLEDLTDPMKGRKEFYISTKLTNTPADPNTYSQLLKKVFKGELSQYLQSDYKVHERTAYPQISKEKSDNQHNNQHNDIQKIPQFTYPRDYFGLKWHQELKGGHHRRAENYSRIRIVEKNLLDLEKIDAFCDILFPDTSDAKHIDILWRTYLQALNHDSISVYLHRTGDYTRARKRFLPKWKGPSKDIRCGEKAVQFLDKVMEESDKLIKQKLELILNYFDNAERGTIESPLNRHNSQSALHESKIKKNIKDKIKNRTKNYEIIGHIPIILCNFSNFMEYSDISDNQTRLPSIMKVLKKKIIKFTLDIPLKVLSENLSNINERSINVLAMNLRSGENVIDLVDYLPPIKDSIQGDKNTPKNPRNYSDFKNKVPVFVENVGVIKRSPKGNKSNNKKHNNNETTDNGKNNKNNTGDHEIILHLDLLAQVETIGFGLSKYSLLFYIKERYFNFPVDIDEYMVVPPSLKGIHIKNTDYDNKAFILENKYFLITFGFTSKEYFFIENLQLKVKNFLYDIFRVDSAEKKIIDELEDILGKDILERALLGIVLSKGRRFKRKSILFQPIRDFGFRIILKNRSDTIKVSVFNDSPIIHFETFLGSGLQAIKFYPDLVNTEVYVDYPFGIEKTKRSGITALNQVIIRGYLKRFQNFADYFSKNNPNINQQQSRDLALLRIQLIHNGTQYHFFSDDEMDHKELFNLMNAGGLRVDFPNSNSNYYDGAQSSDEKELLFFAQQLFKNRKSEFALNFILGDTLFPLFEYYCMGNFKINTHAISAPSRPVHNIGNIESSAPKINQKLIDIIKEHFKTDNNLPLFIEGLNKAAPILTSFRKIPTSDNEYELRLVNYSSRNLQFKMKSIIFDYFNAIYQSDFLGNKQKELNKQSGYLEFELEPMKILTLRFKTN
ncbi:MAG: hypothetical protein ACTSVC_11585 [Promethearchaeota archaeon]